MMLQGKVGVVTGATAGLGRATAFAMAREGAAVVLTGKSMRSDSIDSGFSGIVVAWLVFRASSYPANRSM